MKIKRQLVVFDAADLAAESEFWAGVLGGTVDADDEWHTVLVDGVPQLAMQLAPNHTPPVWPQGPQEQQIHLDLWVDDIKTAHREVMDLGAVLLQDAKEGQNFIVYSDPAGHPFCLCWNE